MKQFAKDSSISVPQVAVWYSNLACSSTCLTRARSHPISHPQPVSALFLRVVQGAGFVCFLRNYGIMLARIEFYPASTQLLGGCTKKVLCCCQSSFFPLVFSLLLRHESFGDLVYNIHADTHRCELFCLFVGFVVNFVWVLTSELYTPGVETLRTHHGTPYLL